MCIRDSIGLIMARRMTFSGAKVLACVEIMPYSSGLKRNIVQCLDDYGIPLLFNHTVVDIHGRERLTGVTIAAVSYTHLFATMASSSANASFICFLLR